MVEIINISVAMPVYNIEDNTPVAVDRIVNQTYTNFRLIIINDGSTITSGEIIDIIK